MMTLGLVRCSLFMFLYCNLLTSFGSTSESGFSILHAYSHQHYAGVVQRSSSSVTSTKLYSTTVFTVVFNESIFVNSIPFPLEGHEQHRDGNPILFGQFAFLFLGNLTCFQALRGWIVGGNCLSHTLLSLCCLGSIDRRALFNLAFCFRDTLLLGIRRCMKTEFTVYYWYLAQPTLYHPFHATRTET
jgi:hypothetical protein